MAVGAHPQQRVCASVRHQMSARDLNESIRIGVQVREASLREPAVRVVRRLVGADVGDEPPLAARGNTEERGEAREFRDQRDLTAPHRFVIKSERD